VLKKRDIINEWPLSSFALGAWNSQMARSQHCLMLLTVGWGHNNLMISVLKLWSRMLLSHLSARD